MQIANLSVTSAITKNTFYSPIKWERGVCLTVQNLVQCTYTYVYVFIPLDFEGLPGLTMPGDELCRSF